MSVVSVVELVSVVSVFGVVSVVSVVELVFVVSVAEFESVVSDELVSVVSVELEFVVSVAELVWSSVVELEELHSTCKTDDIFSSNTAFLSFDKSQIIAPFN